MTRLVTAAAGAGLALALTASPALAAPPSGSPSNPAQVEYLEYSSPDGSYTREYRSVTRYIANEYYTSNNRDQEVLEGYTSDYKQHYHLNDKVIKLTSQNTFTENGETCRVNSQSVTTNGQTRTSRSDKVC
ncbi:hypothetical protein [Sinomonas mesophila]|uniref:hypothetical protein n=1 Tax=Sinomonas mesophila TaxID=1531955 RepID=UPI0011155B57|nr:hypothetical protein [Sinomonas mesophila]